MKKNPKVDAYIAKSAPFARPILTKIRSLFHKACPDIEETMKWSFPHFDYKGVVAGMAAFKEHVAYGFWKEKLLSDPEHLFDGEGDASMGRVKVRAASELPPDNVLLAYIREAVALNEQGVKVVKPKKPPKKPLDTPDDLLTALRKNPKALATFEGFSPSHRREYIEWIVEAKQEGTRQKRLAQAVEWMAEGKPRNWKYMRT
jgi:uncharacterized protein YdeI (YjbR/CyaY-like superfamily)